MESITNQVMVSAHDRGYTVDENGNVYFKNKPRSVVFDRAGYYTFTVRANINEKKYCTRVWVHRLQAYQKFKEKMFEPNILVRHLNGNPLDNSYNNISIGTPSDNMFDIPLKTRIKKSIHASSKNIRFSKEELNSINKDRASGMSYGKICKKYNISSKGTLNYILKKAYYNNKRFI